jgi:diguanylate cyclase (GGDEF)-like protein
MRLTGSADNRLTTLEAKVKNQPGLRMALLIVLALLGIALLDRVTNELPVHHLYYLPIILAAGRFRQTGGFLVASAAGLLYHSANPYSFSWQYAERDLVRLAIFLGVGWVTARLVEDAEQMRQLAHTDDLTGLHNLRSFEACYAALCGEAIKAGTPLTLLVLDLDRLKAINDRYGHLAGAQAVQAVGQVIAQHSPPGALACRYGGDEFIIALPTCSAQQGLETAERIRTTVTQLAPTLAGHTLPVGTLSASIGAASFVPTSQAKPVELSEALFHAADQALYQAKEEGRNRVCCHSPISIAAGA